MSSNSLKPNFFTSHAKVKPINEIFSLIKEDFYSDIDFSMLPDCDVNVITFVSEQIFNNYSNIIQVNVTWHKDGSCTIRSGTDAYEFEDFLKLISFIKKCHDMATTDGYINYELMADNVFDLLSIVHSQSQMDELANSKEQLRSSVLMRPILVNDIITYI